MFNFYSINKLCYYHIISNIHFKLSESYLKQYVNLIKRELSRLKYKKIIFNIVSNSYGQE